MCGLNRTRLFCIHYKKNWFYYKKVDRLPIVCNTYSRRNLNGENNEYYGYTDGGSSGRAYMNCTIKFEATNYGDLLATTASNINIGNKASTLLIAWQNNNELRSNEGTSGSSVKTSYSLPLRGGAATTMGTSAHNYSSAEYGDWICGIEISR